MKKLQLKALSLGAREVLTRDQLKNILGGSDGSGEGKCYTCKKGGEGEYGNGTCATVTGCDAGTCKDYAC